MLGLHYDPESGGEEEELFVPRTIAPIPRRPSASAVVAPFHEPVLSPDPEEEERMSWVPRVPVSARQEYEWVPPPVSTNKRQLPQSFLRSSAASQPKPKRSNTAKTESAANQRWQRSLNGLRDGAILELEMDDASTILAAIRGVSKDPNGNVTKARFLLCTAQSGRGCNRLADFGGTLYGAPNYNARKDPGHADAFGKIVGWEIIGNRIF